MKVEATRSKYSAESTNHRRLAFDQMSHAFELLGARQVHLTAGRRRRSVSSPSLLLHR